MINQKPKTNPHPIGSKSSKPKAPKNGRKSAIPEIRQKVDTVIEQETRQTKNNAAVGQSLIRSESEQTVLTTPFHAIPLSLVGKTLGTVEMDTAVLLGQFEKQVELTDDSHAKMMLLSEKLLEAEFEKKRLAEEYIHRLQVVRETQAKELLSIREREKNEKEMLIEREKKIKEEHTKKKERMGVIPGIRDREDLLSVPGLDATAASSVVRNTMALMAVELEAASEVELHKERKKLWNASNLRKYNSELLQDEKWRVSGQLMNKVYHRSVPGLSGSVFNDFSYVKLFWFVVKLTMLLGGHLVKDLVMALCLVYASFIFPASASLFFVECISVMISIFNIVAGLYVLCVELLPRSETITLSPLSVTDMVEAYGDLDMRAEEFSLVASKLRATYGRFERKKNLILFVYLFLTTGSTERIKTGIYEHEIMTQVLNQGHLRPGRELSEIITSVQRALSSFQTIATNRNIEYSSYATLNTGMLLDLIIPQVVHELGHYNKSF